MTRLGAYVRRELGRPVESWRGGGEKRVAVVVIAVAIPFATAAAVVHEVEAKRERIDSYGECVAQALTLPDLADCNEEFPDGR